MEARAPPAGDDARASFPYFLNADVSFEPRSDVDARVAVEATASSAGTRVDAAPPERARSPPAPPLAPLGGGRGGRDDGSARSGSG